MARDPEETMARQIETAHEKLDDLQLPRTDPEGRRYTLAARLTYLPLRLAVARLERRSDRPGRIRRQGAPGVGNNVCP